LECQILAGSHRQSAYVHVGLTQKGGSVDILDQWEAAANQMIEALQRWRAVRGKADEALAKADYENAVRKFDEVSGQLG
jgi:hypothetical protein